MLPSGRPGPVVLPHPIITVTRVADLPEGFAELAADALGDGQRMLEVLAEDWEAGTLRFDREGEALFAAHSPHGLIGLAGLTRDPYAVGGPDPEAVGRVRRLYVLRAARGAGAGRALVEASAEVARDFGYAKLRVRSPVSAFAFYAACGFLRTVGEKGATHARVV